MVRDYHNYRDRNGNLARWMGTSSGRTPEYMNDQEHAWHKKNSGPNGPTIAELHKMAGGLDSHNEEQRIELLKELRKIRYTTDGLGCRIINSVSTTFEEPGPDSIAPGSARDELEAAEATKFYPNMPWRVLQSDMKCGPEFPFHKVKHLRLTTSDLESASSGPERATGLEALSLQPDVFSMVMEHLSYTDRTALFRSSATLAAAISDSSSTWTVNDNSLMYAEYTAKEFNWFQEEGDLENVPDVRGARNLTITQTSGDRYDEQVAQRAKNSNFAVAFGHIRMFRALQNWGSTVHTLTLRHLPFVDYKVANGILEACTNVKKVEFIGCGLTSYLEICHLLGKIQELQSTRGTSIHFDATPAFCKGSKWAEKRKGCFGITMTDPGVDLGAAITKRVVYELGPAVKAAGQLHMLTDLTSLCRQSLEALPLPHASVPLMLVAWENYEKVLALAAPAKEAWDAVEAASADPREFELRHWPLLLRREATPYLCLYYWSVVRAAFGENGYKQTSDRGYYSCDFQCRVDTYKGFTHLVSCDDCGLDLPRLYFNANSTCEGCRMEKVILRQDQNLEQTVRKVIDALGYGLTNKLTNKPYKTNDESYVPFMVFRQLEEQDLLQDRLELCEIILNAPELKNYFRFAEDLDHKELRSKYMRSRVCVKQYENPYENLRAPFQCMVQMLESQAYRRTLTHEDYEKTDGRGWSLEHKPPVSQW